MSSQIRTLFAAGALLGACVIASPASATAQGNSHKAEKAQKAEQKVERKIDRKMDREIDHRIAKRIVRNDRRRVVRATNRTTRARVLCEDGTWSYASVGCGGHGGLAARQYRAVPRASEQAILHANARSAVARSAVARAAYANGIAAGAIALCNDGTYWHATTRANACYRHGGVNRWR